MPFTSIQKTKVSDSIVFFSAILPAHSVRELQHIQVALQEMIDDTYISELLPFETLMNSTSNLPLIMQGELSYFEKMQAYEILQKLNNLKKYIDTIIDLNSFTGDSFKAQKTIQTIKSFIKSTLSELIDEIQGMAKSPEIMTGDFSSSYYQDAETLNRLSEARGEMPVMQAIADYYETNISPKLISRIHQLTKSKSGLTVDELVLILMHPVAKEVITEMYIDNFNTPQAEFKPELYFILSLGSDRAIELMKLLKKVNGWGNLLKKLNLYDLKEFQGLDISPLLLQAVEILKNKKYQTLLQPDILSPEILLYLLNRLGLEKALSLFQMLTTEPLLSLIQTGQLALQELLKNSDINYVVNVVELWYQHKDKIEFLLKSKLAKSSDFNLSLNLPLAIDIAISNSTIQFLLKNGFMNLSEFCFYNMDATPRDFKRIERVGKQLQKLPQDQIELLAKNTYCRDTIFWVRTGNKYEDKCFLIALSQPEIVKKMLAAIEHDSHQPIGSDKHHDKVVENKIKKILITAGDILLQDQMIQEIIRNSETNMFLKQGILKIEDLLELRKRVPDVKLFAYFKKLNALMNFFNIVTAPKNSLNVSDAHTKYNMSQECLSALLPNIQKVKLPLDLANDKESKIIVEGIRGQMLRLLNLAENEFKSTSAPPPLTILDIKSPHSSTTKSQSLVDQTYNALLEIAKAYPQNEVDPITQDEIEPGNAIYISTGHKFDITTLVDYHNKRNFDYGMKENPDTDSKWLINPYTKQRMGFHDVIRVVEFAASHNLKFEQLNPKSLAVSPQLHGGYGGIYAENEVKWWKSGEFWDYSGRSPLTFSVKYESPVREIKIKPKSGYTFSVTILADKEFEQALSEFSIKADSIKKEPALRSKNAKVNYIYTFQFDMSEGGEKSKKKFEKLLDAVHKKTPSFRNISIIKDELKDVLSSPVWSLR